MKRKIVFSNSLKEKLDTVNYTTENEIWTKSGINNTDDLLEKIKTNLNEKYLKINICEINFDDEVEVLKESSTYFGVIKNEDEVIEGYVFVIPPNYSTRSGVLAQQVFPVMSGLIPNYKESNDKKISNRPIFIINANEVNLTPAMAVNILSGEILGFRYVDIFHRNLEEILMEKGFKGRINNIREYDECLSKLNKDNKRNEIFEIDEKNKTIKFLIVRLKDGIKVNNEPYWFVLKAYASLYLALKDGYKCDMSVFDTLQRGNKTLDAFRDYINNFNKEV